MSPPVRNGLLAVVVLATISAASFAGLRFLRPATDLGVFEVQRGRFVHRVDAEGVLVAEQATVLSAPRATDGPMKIAWLAADGSYVDEDQVVVRFDPTDMEKELYSGESDRANAVQQVQKKEIEQETTSRNLERDSEMADLQLAHARDFQSTDAEIFGRNEIIESAIDEELATKRRDHAQEIRAIRDDLGQVELALLELEKREAQLTIDKAHAGLRELEIRAPHAGIFVLRRDWGEPPTIGQMAWGGMPLAEIPQLDVMKAQVFVLEADAGGVEEGIEARVVLEAHPEQEIEAKVRRVAAVAKRRNRWSPVQYFEVELELAFTNPETMKPGQRVRASLLLQDLPEVLAVPRAALFQDPDGKAIVYRRRGRGFEAVPVEMGPTGLGRAVIVSGLEAGDVIALGNPNRVPAQGDSEAREPNGPQTGGPGR